MRPAEVLDAQADLLSRLENHQFKKIIAGLVVDTYRRGPREEAELTESAFLAADVLHNEVSAAYAYRVTHEMCDLVQVAAAGLEELDRIDPDLAPTGCGIVCFDKPLPVKDIRGRTMLMHWLVWGPGARIGDTPATLIWTFNDAWRQPDEVDSWMIEELTEELGTKQVEELLQVRGRWATLSMDALVRDRRLGPVEVMPTPDKAAEILAEGAEPVAGGNTVRLVHALWLLLNQTITVTETEHPDRAGRRRAERKRILPQVTVIKMRRAKNARQGDGEGRFEYSHAWLVRGHWRWQVCGENYPGAVEMGPGEFRARLWIHPYRKGPEDAPLRITEHVYSLER